MQKLIVMLEYFFDYILSTVILLLALLLVFPFTTIYALTVGYFNYPVEGRKLSNIFRLFKENAKNYLLYGLLSTVLLLVPILTIRVINLPETTLTSVVLFVSWTVLFIGLVFTLFAPLIIAQMEVTFKELIFNTYIVTMRGTFISLFLIIGVGAIVLISLYYPLVLIPSLYFIALSNYHAVNTIILKIKKEMMQNEKEI